MRIQWERQLLFCLWAFAQTTYNREVEGETDMAGTIPVRPLVGYRNSSAQPNADAIVNCAYLSDDKNWLNSSGSGDANDIVLFAFHRKSDGALRFVIYDDSADAVAVST